MNGVFWKLKMKNELRSTLPGRENFLTSGPGPGLRLGRMRISAGRPTSRPAGRRKICNAVWEIQMLNSRRSENVGIDVILHAEFNFDVRFV